MKYLIQILNDFKKGENLDQILIIILIIVISLINLIGLKDIFGVTIDKLIQSITLAVLGLVAIGLLVTRYKIENISNNNDTINNIKFELQKPKRINELLESEKEINLLGFGLRSTIHDNYYLLQKKVQDGSKIKALIVDPDSIDMKVIAKRFSRGGTPKNFIEDYKKTVMQFKQLRLSATIPDNVQLKLVPFVPSFSLYLFPKANRSGLVFVEIYGYKSHLRAVPKFMIFKNKQEVWYNHFDQQFNIMWEDSKKVDLTK